MVIASDEVDTYVTLIYDELMWPNIEKPEQVNKISNSLMYTCNIIILVVCRNGTDCLILD